MNDGMKAHVIDLLKSCPERRRKIALLHYFRSTVSSNMQLMTDFWKSTALPCKKNCLP